MAVATAALRDSQVPPIFGIVMRCPMQEATLGDMPAPSFPTTMTAGLSKRVL